MSQGYPPQGGYPQGGYPPEGGYPQGGYPPQGGPPPQGYGQPPQGNTTVIITGGSKFGRDPVQMQCPHCSAQIVTSVDYIVGSFTWMIACLLFWFVFVILSCIPCCIDSCKDARHTCPNCKQILGTYRRMDDCC